jgi:DNA-binding transcriptional LysR family regulator
VGPRQRWAVVGSPAYFAAHEPPRILRDLRQHTCIRHRGEGGVVRRWLFVRDGVAHDLDVDGPLTLNDQDLMLRAALEGTGLAYVLEAKAEPHLAAGRLMRVLADWCPELALFALTYPSDQPISPALRLVVAAAQREFR